MLLRISKSCKWTDSGGFVKKIRELGFSFGFSVHGENAGSVRITMHLVIHISDQHVCTLHGQMSACVAIDVTSTVLNGRTQEADVDRGTVCVHAHLSCLACYSVSEYCRRCGLSAGLQRRVPCSDRRCINYRHEACDMHLYTISFDLWAPLYRFKTVIYGRQNLRIRIQTNCGKVCRFGCELGICNNTSNKLSCAAVY